MTDYSSQPDGGAAHGALAPYRILDLTTERSWLTGRLLADLGATVTKVEPPGGDPGRLRGPYSGDESGPENSLTWWAYNRGKRSVTLDLSTADGRALFLRLAASADAVLESFPPGQLEKWGLGLEALAAANRGIVLTRVTPFGQTGPYANLAVNDLVLAAMGGPVWMAGDSDRPPVRTTVPQYFLHAAAEAAVHTTAALYHAGQTGEGQQIDVSAQLATVRTLMNAAAYPHMDGTVPARTTFGEPSAASPYRTIFACADGHVMATVGFGPGLKGYIDWLAAEDAVPQFLTDLTDEDLAPAALAARQPELAGRVSTVLDAFFATRTKKQLMEQALPYRLMLVPINTVADIRADDQLDARGYFQPVDHGDRGQIQYPSTWAHLSATPLTHTPRAPRVGEHNNIVWVTEAGLSSQDILLFQQAGTI